MSQIQKIEERQKTVRQLLLQSQAQIMKALPKSVDGNRMFRAYMTAIQLTPRLLECEPMSLISGVIQAAQFGLSLDPVLGEAYLVPRWNKNTRSNFATFQLGYKGLRKLALQGDSELQDIYAHWVYQNDVFEFTLGDEPRIDRHVPSEEDDPGPLRLAYAVAVWKDGYKRRHIMLGRDIRKIRDNADGYAKAERDRTYDSPWHENEQEMWRKTVLRALCNQMQLASDNPLGQALQADSIEGQDILPTANITPLASVSVVSEATKEPARRNALDAAADAAEEEDGVPVDESEVEETPKEATPPPPKATRRRAT